MKKNFYNAYMLAECGFRVSFTTSITTFIEYLFSWKVCFCLQCLLQNVKFVLFIVPPQFLVRCHIRKVFTTEHYSSEYSTFKLILFFPSLFLPLFFSPSILSFSFSLQSYIPFCCFVLFIPYTYTRIKLYIFLIS